MLKELLEKHKIQPETLTIAERETLEKWLAHDQTNPRTTADMVSYLKNMKDAVAMELSEAKADEKRDLYLKARLNNYIMLIAFMEQPEKAREYIEKQLPKLIK